MPFQRTPTGLVLLDGLDKIMQNITQIIGTPVGTYPWRATFGCRITRLRHMNNSNDLQQLARVDVADALARWEPRVKVTSVMAATRTDANRNILDLTVTYVVAGTPQTIKLDI